MNSNSQTLFEFDKSFGKKIIGTDEAGRGPGAGGVFAAAVYFPEVTEGLIKDLAVLNDSKKLTPKKRKSIYDTIITNSVSKIICVEVEEIEKINILNSSLKAMRLACNSVAEQLGGDILTLVDGNKLIKEYTYPQEFVIKGDSKSASIAAASILAKVTRDRYMENLDSEFPLIRKLHLVVNSFYSPFITMIVIRIVQQTKNKSQLSREFCSSIRKHALPGLNRHSGPILSSLSKALFLCI